MGDLDKTFCTVGEKMRGAAFRSKVFGVPIIGALDIRVVSALPVRRPRSILLRSCPRSVFLPLFLSTCSDFERKRMNGGESGRTRGRKRKKGEERLQQKNAIDRSVATLF